MLPTIVSRCQVIRLRPVPTAEIASYLVEVSGAEPAHAEALARASRGRPGWAILAVKAPDALTEREQRGADLLRLLRGGRLDRIQYADGLAERWTNGSPGDVREVLEIWMDVWRDALLLQQGLGGRVRNLNLAGDLEALVGALPPGELQAALESTLLTADSLERNASPRLALETHALLLPRLS
jgi:DNA polymerase-3 subunit delta'